MYDFGDVLKTLRKKNNLTQQQLAKKLNVSESLISRYESNEVQPPFDTLGSLAAIFNVTIDELCGTEHRNTLSLYGLTKEQEQILKALALRFRTFNNEGTLKFTNDQLSMIGCMFAEVADNFTNTK